MHTIDDVLLLKNQVFINRPMRISKMRKLFRSTVNASLFSVIFLNSISVNADTIWVSDFSTYGLQGWTEKEFDGKTHYSLDQDEGKKVLHAVSRESASGLIKEIEIDLDKTPFLKWSWKVNNTINSENERIKKGDDFSARVYVIFSDGPFFWQTKSLNYVWANEATIGEHWPNPYTRNAQMFAIQSGDDGVGQWQHEVRNVREDLKKIFGKDIKKINAIAIMSDTDQTGGETQAWFDNIEFTD